MTPCTLNPDLAAALAVLSTGHESDAPATAAQVADALAWTKGKAAAALGRLAARGLVERGTGADGLASWARYDSAAPGLAGMAREALEAAETVRPVRAQVEALETFGPDLGDGCHGLARKADAPRRPESYFGACESAREAAALGLFHRAAALALEGRPYVAGHGRRARLEALAADYAAQAVAQDAPAQVEAQAVAQDAPRADGCPDCRAWNGDGQAHAPGCPQGGQARAQVPAYGDTLPNGCRVLDVAQGAAWGRVYVLAETLGRAGHPFATWALDPGTWATHWGTYHETARAAADTLAERAAHN